MTDDIQNTNDQGGKAGGQESVNNDGKQGTSQDAAQDQGAELKGNSILTKPDGDGKQDGNESDKEAGKNKSKDEGKDDPDDKLPDKPEDYALKFAEGTQIDKELLEGFQKQAHAMGLSKRNAQKLASFYETNAAKTAEKFQAEQQKAIETAKSAWEEEIQKSPNFAEERDYARTALRQFGDQELFNLLDQTNLGSHPKVWAFMAKIGKELAEPKFRGKSASGKEKTAAEILYPNQGK